jgi:hypothetical protein
MRYLAMFAHQHEKLITGICQSRFPRTATPDDAQQTNSLTKNVRRNADKLHPRVANKPNFHLSQH